MQEIAIDIQNQLLTAERGTALFRQSQDDIHRRTDRLFARLMVFQWLAGIGAALWISPRNWAGAYSQTHVHLWAAIFLGGAITSFPVLLAWLQPGRALTRHTIAVAQMLTSALLIHLSGGRIETHFHVFGSLAFLAFYRDWRVLITATVVVAADHFLRGVFWPQSVFGVLTAPWWRWLEHAGWVIFEDFFLLISVRQGLGEMRQVAERRARLETLNRGIEQVVETRTRELQLEIEERKQTELRLEKTYAELREASRRAGMAEVATSVLHNVGNVLNSVNVSSSLLAEILNESKAPNLAKVVAVMREHEADLGSFLTGDPKGKQLFAYTSQLAEFLSADQEGALKELYEITRNIEHIKDIVAMQQNYGKVSGLAEPVQVQDLVEDALRINAGALTRHDVETIREYERSLPEITIEKHKVLQILVNLIQNAKHACDDSGLPDKRMTIRVANGEGRIKISVADNGIGIAPENLNRIFNHGFTTRKNGHGFGLHSGALAAKELGGTLLAHSAGPGKGATFTLELPVSQQTN